MIKGMDISSLAEVERCGGKFYDNGVELDAMKILRSYGTDYIRLRLWNDPYDETGGTYGGGGNDFKVTLELAQRAQALGLSYLLDIQYSDFWADPQKQRMPKAWAGMDEKETEQAVYDYTVRTLKLLAAQGAAPAMVAVGNELTSGLLWPYGKVPEYPAIARFVSAGIRGVRAVDKNIPVMIHLDNGGNNELYRHWFDQYLACGGADFDYIGMSYYPFWHGTLAALEANMNDVALRYHKDILVAEVSMGFTMEDYQSYEKLPADARKGYATKPELTEKLEYPMTKEGQAAFMADLMTRIGQVAKNRGKGFFYWEPAWLPVPGSQWATKAGRDYAGEPGAGGNEWANQALFDYDGNALPALATIRDFK